MEIPFLLRGPVRAVRRVDRVAHHLVDGKRLGEARRRLLVLVQRYHADALRESGYRRGRRRLQLERLEQVQRRAAQRNVRRLDGRRRGHFALGLDEVDAQRTEGIRHDCGAARFLLVFRWDLPLRLRMGMSALYASVKVVWPGTTRLALDVLRMEKLEC